jgi:hypothetical protein
MADLRIIDTLRRLFPPVQKGPPYPQLQSASRAPNRLGPYAIPPLLPFDVFAITAYLLELSGAYHHISPLPMGPMGEDGRPRSATADGGPALRCIEVTQAETETCRAAAQAWRAKPDWADKAGQQKWLRQSFSEVTSLWTELFGVHGRQPVFQPLQPHSAAPDWWRIAHQLLMIADEACEGVGFTPPDTDEITHENRPWFDDVLVMIAMEEFTDTTWYGVKSLSSADPNVACVLPKCRTTPVGCTLRSLSHHLALLPPQGITRARWYPPPPGDMPLDDTQLNVLLVPFPFEIPHTAFSGSASRADLRGNWGNFRLKQTWLPDRDHPVKTRAFVQRLENFIGQLADVATKDYSARNIHVVVLPECSINSAIYAELVPRLRNGYRNWNCSSPGSPITPDVTATSSLSPSIRCARKRPMGRPTGISPIH